MTDEHRADVDKVRKVAEDLGTPGQDATPNERDADERVRLQDELRRRQVKGDDTAIADR
jgi:hypothetical protein